MKIFLWQTFCLWIAFSLGVLLGTWSEKTTGYYRVELAPLIVKASNLPKDGYKMEFVLETLTTKVEKVDE